MSMWAASASTEPNELREKRYTFMTRNTAREIATHLAYELSFNDLPVEEFLDLQLSGESFAALAPEHPVYEERPNAKQEEYIRRLVSGVAEHAAELDADIEKYARGWRFERISLVASAIMRVAMYEMLYMADIPAGVAINEAVEIAKHYESPEVQKAESNRMLQRKLPHILTLSTDTSYFHYLDNSPIFMQMYTKLQHKIRF